MKTFNQIREAFSGQKPDVQSDTMNLNDMHKYLGAAKMKLIINHPDFKEHFSTPMTTRTPIGARFRRTNGVERVEIAHAPIGDNKFRKMVTFTLGHSGRKISQTDTFVNRNDDRYSSVEGKPIKWDHFKTNIHKVDAALEKRLKKKRKE
ncbi:hypothetical protein EBR43_08400 [bacterium]|nr:hypothetical protein [bacterium]